VWEYQALIKARPAAGQKAMGERLLKDLEPLVYRKEWTEHQLERFREIKHRFEAMTRSRGETETNVKMGRGGIRDIEFSVQAIQLRHAFQQPSLRQQNTLDALEAIRRLNLLEELDCETLRQGYLFLRGIEDYLHLYDNRREFNIPGEKRKLRALARTLGFSDSDQEKAGDRFLSQFQRTRHACRELFERIFF
jgi:glutamate-ammonia-ligase adenylyltransferase